MWFGSQLKFRADKTVAQCKTKLTMSNQSTIYQFRVRVPWIKVTEGHKLVINTRTTCKLYISGRL